MEQLALFAPEIVRRHGLREFHTSPYVSHGKRPDGSWGPIYRVPAEAAWQYPEIELRTPLSCPVLLFDCDRGANNPLAAAWADVLPFPSWICWRSETQTCHAAYCLRRPVLTYEAALPVPQQALARISEYFIQELRADPGYTGVLTHNPVHPRWQTDWGHQGGYSLGELGQFIPPGYRMPRLDKRLSIEGRNTGLFRAGMKWCGLPRNWGTLGGVEAYLAELNQTLVMPLPVGEVKTIAWSVEKISRRNLLSGQTQANFSRIQAARGRKGGLVSGAKRYQGSNEAERPWEAAGISRRAWYYKQAEQPRESTEQQRPWEAEGVSRRTWYRRQAGQQTGQRGQRNPWETAGVSRATWYRQGNRLT